MGVRWIRSIAALALASQWLSSASKAATWFPQGPFGGDARAFAPDPRDSRHLYLGTETGWIYDSADGGSTWRRLSQINHRNDLVIDHMLSDAKDPQRLIVGAWTVDRPDGGIFISEDGGKSWTVQSEMKGQSVRSLTQSATDPELMVAGTLQGVFRSTDGGKHWQSISPAGSTEIHEIESVAIDPVDPKIIYAGTWHLPWKTVDGGAHWQSIKQGIIDDSDVFSIIVDRQRPQIVYASACSGIYKSINAGSDFIGGVTKNKLQGIPATARRTRKLLQDPAAQDTVYAGTTEGLYRTTNGGQSFSRLTGPDVIVNDVYVDPKAPTHVLIATDRGGVLRSEDGAATFQASNSGFSTRQITSYAMDSQHPGTLFVGVVNDKATGGVFESADSGLHWSQRSEGLGGRDVFSLSHASDGTLLAGTNHGIFRWTTGAWVDSSKVEIPAEPVAAKPATVSARRGKGKPAVRAASAKPKAPAATTSRLDDVIYSLASQEGTELAGTNEGLFQSKNNGLTWVQLKTLSMPEVRFVAVQGPMQMAAGLRRIALSMDKGATWDVVPMPADLTQIATIAVDDQKNLWVGGREGAFYSTDYGMTWKTLRNLFVTQVDNIYFDPAGHRVLVTAVDSTVAFAAHVPDYKVSYWDTGWKLRFIRPVGDHLIGATLYDGVVVEPRMVESAETKPAASPAVTP